MVVPLIVLTTAVLVLGWLVRRARTTSDDVIDELKGPTAGAYLPAIHPDVRDVVVPRSQAVDADTERFRASGPHA